MMRAAIILFAIVALAVVSGFADTRTTRGKLKAAKAETELQYDETASAEALPPDSITVEGYDKALRSMKESARVTNRYSSPLDFIVLNIVYRTVGEGKMLHARSVRVDCDIPPGETRQLEWRAWDRQQRYYYHDTRVVPRSAKAVPYAVEIIPVDCGFGGGAAGY